MINQFATYLMNLSYAGNSMEIIAPDYSSKVFPSDIGNMYSALYPGRLSRYNIQFYTYYYLRFLEACQQDDVVYIPDTRVTYNLDTDFSYFNIYSNVVESTPIGFTLQINGLYSPTNSVNGSFESFSISLYNPSAVVIQSITTGEYLTSSSRQATFTTACVLPLIQDGFLNKTKFITVGDTGLSFEILGNLTALPYITSQFIFNAYAPLVFNYQSIINNTVYNTALVTTLFSNYSYLSYELNLYRTANNDVLKLSAILRAMYKRINNL